MILVAAIARDEWADGMLALGGFTALAAWPLTAFLLLMYNQRVHYLLVRVFCSDEILAVRDWIVVEIEDASTYDKFKVVPDDIGVMYPEGGRILLWTNSGRYDLTAELENGSLAFAGNRQELRSIRLSLDPAEPDRVLKPIPTAWSPRLQMAPSARIEWFLNQVRGWNPSGQYVLGESPRRVRPFWKVILGVFAVVAAHSGISFLTHGGFSRNRASHAAAVKPGSWGPTVTDLERFERVLNGTAYDRSALLVEGSDFLVVPGRARVERTGRYGLVEIYERKSLSFFGHPPDSMSIWTTRLDMGCVWKVGGDSVLLAPYGEWDSHIEGGATMELRIVVPPTLSVLRSTDSTGEDSPCRSGGWIPSPRRGAVDYRTDSDLCGPGWHPLHQAPDPRRMAAGPVDLD
jgi:hypothetical protein